MVDQLGVPVNFRELKQALAGASSGDPAKCGVVVFSDNTASIRVSSKRSAKALVRDLLKDGKDAGLQRRFQYFGGAYADEFPGTLFMTLNKSPGSGLDTKLRAALRGSGYNKFDITVVESEEEEGELSSSELL